MEFFSTEALVALLTLTSLEVVLGINNVVFIAIVAGKLPEAERDYASKRGGLLKRHDDEVPAFDQGDAESSRSWNGASCRRGSRPTPEPTATAKRATLRGPTIARWQRPNSRACSPGSTAENPREIGVMLHNRARRQ